MKKELRRLKLQHDIINKMIIMLLTTFLLCLVTITVSASSITTRKVTDSEYSTIKNSSVGFSVKPIYHESQNSGNVNYWSMLVKPKQVVKIQLQIINGDADQKFDVNVNSAITNGNLTVDYSKNKKNVEKMLVRNPPLDYYSATKVADSKNNTKIIKVNKNTVVTVPIQITVPPREFDGQVVGGVSVTRHASNQETNKTVNNIYNYTYAIVMYENKKKVKPNVKLLSLQAKAKQFNNTVTVNVKNTTSSIVSGVAVNGEVTDSKGKQVSRIVIKNGTISPLSKFGLVFRNTDKKWSAGKYHVKLLMTDNGNHKWVVDQNITIKSDKKTAVEKVTEKSSNNIMLILVLGLSGMLLILICIILYLRKYHRTAHN